MRVFVAGASGVIGRPLVAQFVAAGHEVTGMTRSRPEAVEDAGATAVICDALDAAALEAAVAAAEPDEEPPGIRPGAATLVGVP